MHNQDDLFSLNSTPFKPLYFLYFLIISNRPANIRDPFYDIPPFEPIENNNITSDPYANVFFHF